MTTMKLGIGMRMFKRIGLALCLMVGQSVFAQASIESVTGSVQGGTEVVRIDLSQAINALPTGFAIQSPARIALDFPGVSNAMGFFFEGIIRFVG